MTVETLHYFNLFLGLGAILLQIVLVVALLLLFFGPKKNIFLDFIEKHFLFLSFIVTFSAVVFSLFYSEIINFIPCYLCWYQRIFMFPLVFLFGIALWYKPARNVSQNSLGGDKTVIKYALPLAFIGFLFAIYQNFFYYFGENSSSLCDTFGVSCYQRLISEFGGYISFPMFSLTIFSTILVLILIALFYKKDENLQ